MQQSCCYCICKWCATQSSTNPTTRYTCISEVQESSCSCSIRSAVAVLTSKLNVAFPQRRLAPESSSHSTAESFSNEGTQSFLMALGLSLATFPGWTIVLPFSNHGNLTLSSYIQVETKSETDGDYKADLMVSTCATKLTTQPCI
jgi:hypothetical protein